MADVNSNIPIITVYVIKLKYTSLKIEKDYEIVKKLYVKTVIQKLENKRIKYTMSWNYLTQACENQLYYSHLHICVGCLKSIVV